MIAMPRDVTFGLLGRKLGHSWSPQIHAELGSSPYALVEREPEEVEAFVREGSWRGLNVTIPYKRTVVALADEMSPRVSRLGAANTLVRRDDGSIFAENTDVLGFQWLLERFAQEQFGQAAHDAFKEGEVLILGSGGACQAVRSVLVDELGCETRVISRTGEDSYEGLAERHPNACLVVNTTPVGMYPRCPESPLDSETISRLSKLRGIVDIVYNPERTGLCLAAERLGIPSVSGLGMLVAQAAYSSELFQGIQLDMDRIEHIVENLRDAMRNIVLIGMPGAGKSSTGRSLARLLRRPFIDMDDAFEMEVGTPAGDYIQVHGEPAFRSFETAVLSTYGSRSGIVIACGGGVVTQPENYDLLHQNGTIIHIDRPIDQLSSDGRPLSLSRGVEKLAEERMGLYRDWADITLRCTGSAASDAQLARQLLSL